MAVKRVSVALTYTPVPLNQELFIVEHNQPPPPPSYVAQLLIQPEFAKPCKITSEDSWSSLKTPLIF